MAGIDFFNKVAAAGRRRGPSPRPPSRRISPGHDRLVDPRRRRPHRKRLHPRRQDQPAAGPDPTLTGRNRHGFTSLLPIRAPAVAGGRRTSLAPGDHSEPRAAAGPDRDVCSTIQSPTVFKASGAIVVSIEAYSARCAGLAGLEQVIQAGELERFDVPVSALLEGLVDLREVFLGRNLQIFFAVDRQHGALDFPQGGAWIVGEEEAEPGVVDCVDDGLGESNLSRRRLFFRSPAWRRGSPSSAAASFDRAAFSSFSLTMMSISRFAESRSRFSSDSEAPMALRMSWPWASKI